MIESYSNGLIKFVLTHYMDIMWGKITPEEMGDFCKSAGRKNPLETALIWKSDIDRAIVSLSKKTSWADALPGMTDSMVLHLCRSNQVSSMQRDLINNCILRDCCKVCKDTGYRGSKLCYNEGIITRMRRFLNKEYVEQHIKGRDDSGLFTREANASSKT